MTRGYVSSVQGVSDRGVSVLGVSVQGVHVRGGLSCHHIGSTSGIRAVVFAMCSNDPCKLI